ncbi:MAG: transposase [Comamonas sp.]|nr:transposase [Comamonas sp.]
MIRNGQISRRPRRSPSAAFKIEVALNAVKGDKTPAEVAQKHDAHPSRVTKWRCQLQDRAADVFRVGSAAIAAAHPVFRSTTGAPRNTDDDGRHCRSGVS